MGDTRILKDQSAGGAGYKARKQHRHDNYETPSDCVRHIANREPLFGKVLEPCCGPGSICREVIRLRPAIELISSDLRDEPQIFEHAHRGVDFLEDGGQADDLIGDGVDFVIMNPPFKRALDFVLKAIRIARHGVYVFLRTDWLEAEARWDDLWSLGFLRRVWVYVKRVQCFPEGRIDLDESGKMCFAWYCFRPVANLLKLPHIGHIPDAVDFTYDTRIGMAEELAMTPEQRKERRRRKAQTRKKKAEIKKRIEAAIAAEMGEAA